MKTNKFITTENKRAKKQKSKRIYQLLIIKVKSLRIKIFLFKNNR